MPNFASWNHSGAGGCWSTDAHVGSYVAGAAVAGEITPASEAARQAIRLTGIHRCFSGGLRTGHSLVSAGSPRHASLAGDGRPLTLGRHKDHVNGANRTETALSAAKHRRAEALRVRERPIGRRGASGMCAGRVDRKSVV